MSSSSSFSPQQMMEHPQLLELSLESRSRSSTWPCPPDEDELTGGRGLSESPVPNMPPGAGGSLSGGGLGGGVGKTDSTKKMRNAWGNMSYADLITQAILSSQDKRLTLSEIYDWIVQNVPYFSDKASSPSTAGWKNSVRHNLSLHSRFVKVQNESSGKSSWWTVNLDAKSTRGRRRSSSVDNTNAPSPRSKKREKKKQLKKMKNAGSSNDLQTSSPCDSPTTTGFLQAPWSPSPHIDCPSPTNSDRSATYSPVAFSPVLQRSRNATPVSPLVSPPALEHENVFSGSNSSLLDSFHDNSGLGGGLLSEDSVPEHCITSLASLNLKASREGMGSSSSLSSLNSPRLQLKPSPQQQHVFNFPLQPDGSSGYSSVSDGNESSMVTDAQGSSLAPPTYEEHVTGPAVSPVRLNSGTPTRHTSFGQASHPLHLSLAYEGRPRSGSEPAPPRITPPHHQPHPNHAHTIHTVQHHHPYHQPSHIPRDIDPSLFSNDFKVDIQDVIQQELQYGGDFSLSAGTGAMETQSVHHHGQYSNNTAYTALNPNIHVHHGNYVATGHPTGHQFYTQSHDPTLTSVALDSSSPNLSRRPNPGY